MNADQFQNITSTLTLISVLAVLAVVGVGFSRLLSDTREAMAEAEAALVQAEAATERLEQVVARLDRRAEARAEEAERRELERCRDRNSAQRFTRRSIRTLVLALEELGGREEAIRVLLASVPEPEAQDVDCDADGVLTENDYANVDGDIGLPSPFLRDQVETPTVPVRAAGPTVVDAPDEPSQPDEPAEPTSPAPDPAPGPKADPAPADKAPPRNPKAQPSRDRNAHETVHPRPRPQSRQGRPRRPQQAAEKAAVPARLPPQASAGRGTSDA